MRIALVDPAGWSYTLDTPYSQPFGGSQSALCYLAAELAKLGHAVTIFNGISEPAEDRGVELRNLSEIAPVKLNGFDRVIVLSAAIGRSLQRDYRVSVPLVLWTQHASDQPPILALKKLNERTCWAGFVFVSNWQRERYERAFLVPGDKSRVLRNAVSPAFVQASPGPPWFGTGEPPILFYSSTPFRGLDVLLQAFPAIRAALPGTRLRIFSSMQVYQINAENDAYRELYERARSLEGVEYLGSVGQSRLADELAGAAALTYPSTYAETSCIAALEAMAVGARVVTTPVGALPETTNGFATLVDWHDDRTVLAKSFAAATIDILREMQRNPAEAAARRDEQVRFIRANYLWPARAREWADWLSQIGRSG